MMEKEWKLDIKNYIQLKIKFSNKKNFLTIKILCINNIYQNFECIGLQKNIIQMQKF